MALILLVTLALAGPPKTEYSVRPFDPTANRLSAHYIGHDPSRIYQKLSALPRTKREFETSAQHANRMKAALAKPLFGGVSLSDDFAVVTPAALWYDADQASLNGKVEMGLDLVLPPAGAKPDDPLATLYAPTFLDREARVGSYIGSTAMGIKKRIEQYQHTRIGLFLMNPKEWRLDDHGYPTTEAGRAGAPISIIVRGSVPVSGAKRAKQNARVLAVYRIMPPYVGMAKEEDSPTLSSPYHTRTTTFLIVARLEQIVLFDLPSGKVIARALPPGAAMYEGDMVDGAPSTL